MGFFIVDIVILKMLKSMVKDLIVFVMVNFNLEIVYDVVIKIREDIIMVMGRSDYFN